MISSTPNFKDFIPISQQAEVIYDVENYDYSTGVYQFMLSGSVGSSKSLALAYLIVDHCTRFPGAAVGIGRLALPRLKGTLCQKIREHLAETGIGYSYDETKGSFKFGNGSQIIPFSWTDKKYEKFRSYELSAMVFEELSENHGDHKKAYLEAFARVGRLTHIPHRWVGSASNPDSPSHWLYKYFINTDRPNRRVYYSRTSDNPFLPSGYINDLKEVYDAKMYRRMVLGEWLEISDDVIYYTYDRQHNFRDYSYDVDDRFPIYLCYDFNIGLGKPLSLALHQNIGGVYHVFAEVVVEGQRTRESLEEAKERGYLGYDTNYVVHGDANGGYRNTRSPESDYDIIEDFLSGEDMKYDLQISRKNPPLKTRHNLVNGKICNANGARRLFVYKDAPTADEGFRLTCLKKGAQYLEDDNNRYQHITTGLGYSVCEIEQNLRSKDSASGMISMRGGRRL